MFARLTQTVPKTEKTLKSLGFQGILVRETGLELMAALKPINPCTIWHKLLTKFYNTMQPN